MVADLHAAVPGLDAAVELGACGLGVLQRHLAERQQSIGSLTARLQREVVEDRGDGRVGLEYFSDLGTPVDVIICDLEMPNMDGMEFIRTSARPARRRR